MIFTEAAEFEVVLIELQSVSGTKYVIPIDWLVHVLVDNNFCFIIDRVAYRMQILSELVERKQSINVFILLFIEYIINNRFELPVSDFHFLLSYQKLLELLHRHTAW